MPSSSDSDSDSDDERTASSANGTTNQGATHRPSPSTSHPETQSVIQSLSSILPSPLPPSLSPHSLLHDSSVAFQISSLLRDPNSGSGNNNLCRWFYNTFQSNIPDLQLVVLRFIPTIAGIYLSRVPNNTPLAGFEAVLLALYAHETNARNGQAVTVSIPDLSHPSVYHESKVPIKNNATELSLAVISPSLEPHGTVRSTRRARIVGVALELYYSKISQMPLGSKIEFCEFCKLWAGVDGNNTHKKIEMGKQKEEEEEEEEEGVKIVVGKNNNKSERIPLPWELLYPILRILGHCIMGCGGNYKNYNCNNKKKNKENDKVVEAASDACRSLHARAMHDINPKAILATESLLRLLKMEMEKKDDDFDPTEIPMANVIAI